MTNSTNRIMRTVFLALVPAILVKTYFWGLGALVLVAVAQFATALVEVLAQYMRGKGRQGVERELGNLSGMVTATLLALSLPPNIPWWIMFEASLLAILLGKVVYGGLGQNIFNPAMVGVAIFQVTWPQYITFWANPAHAWDLGFQWAGLTGNLSSYVASHQAAGAAVSSVGAAIGATIDATTQATPLTALKSAVQSQGNLLQVLTEVGQQSGKFIFYAAAIAAGGVWLLVRKVASVTLTVSTLVGFLTVATLHWALATTPTLDPFQALIYGSVVLGAFFIVTDPVTAPQYGLARIIYGLLIGALAYSIRQWSNYNDGVAFAVLLGNLLVSLLDRYFRPREYGSVRGL